MASPKRTIRLQGCRQHNLQNISVEIPKGEITVLTGVSGSGKSSLAFDTIFAEGQRRYLEYLSPGIRTWIKQMPKPEVDVVEGLSPTLAIGQGGHGLHPTGIIATYTDLHDFFVLLFTTLGEQHSPKTGKRLVRYSRQEAVDLILHDYPEGSRIQLLSPVSIGEASAADLIAELQKQGYIRFKINGVDWNADDPLPNLEGVKAIDVLVDRIELRDGVRDRLSLSVETAMDLSQGILKIQEGKAGPIRYFTEIYVCPETGLSFAPLKPADFHYHSPRGQCPHCHGKGTVDGKICPVCHGGRLKPESLACTIFEKNIQQLYAMTIADLSQEVEDWDFAGKEKMIAHEILPHIQTRLRFLNQVGLGYLSLDRPGNTLSDGEAQRIQLASQIGAKLSGIIYVLDEPSLGLHRQDVQHLIQVMKELLDLGNTLILVEHERSLIKEADYIIELGPGAGFHGGKIIYKGTYKGLLEDKQSITGQWLSGRRSLPTPPRRSLKNGQLKVKNASLHNLERFSVNLPLNCFVGLCGVSGSGKSTLALDIIAEQLREYLSSGVKPKNLEGYESIRRVVMGHKLHDRFTARSIPATYVGLMTPLRELFAETRLAKARGYTASRFSLNKKGGRCERCEGLGQIKVSMQLMPDLYVPCDVCHGKRYNSDTLQCTWSQHSIADVLDMTIDKVTELFEPVSSLYPTLNLMNELGLEYLTLGQSFTTLSAGEIQRLRLVSDLATRSIEPTLYILDEPSSGLHLHDIEKLVAILHRLIERGHSVLCIEHHLDLLNQSDWIIELGPEGGPNGGKLIFEGTAKKLAKADTPTGRLLK